MITLYGYWRSSAAYRVRIALHLKGIAFDNVSIHLVKDGGQQFSEDYKALNPASLVPYLVDGDVKINQSMAMLEYLDEAYPQCSIYPKGVKEKAAVRAFANDIACDIHPLNNLRVLSYLVNECDVNEENKMKWYHHWINKGFAALEKQLALTSGKYSFGDDVTAADLCLIPQVYNANRFGVDMSVYPNINEVVNNCNELDAFKLALPENQPDAT